MNVKALKNLLNECNYDKKKTAFLVEGFSNGFELGYKGPRTNIRREASNLKLRVGSPTELWNKVMKEVALGRYAGPFETPPFDNYVQSPIGLVPKDGGRKTRLIFHLSYPREGMSVNSEIPKEKCTVVYPDFDEAIKLCQKIGKNTVFLGKSDMSLAFRHLPMRVSDFWLLTMKATNPETGKTYYFVDKCLPFGSLISCAIFQAFSDAVAYIVSVRMTHPNINYLDDYLFIAATRFLCNKQLDAFIEICNEIRFPVATEKTEYAVQVIVFLGLLIDCINRIVCIPKEKIDKAKELIDTFLTAKKGKVTVLQVQKLAGFLNFLCKSIVPGRAFTTRLYSLVNGNLKAHHHVRLTLDIKLDLKMWLQFLESPQCFCRPFMDYSVTTADEIFMFSDASRNPELGFRAICQNDWMVYKWSESKLTLWCKNFVQKMEPSITYLELYVVTVGILEWIHRFKNRRITLFCDNEGAVKIINRSASKCRNCMVLVRLITLESMKHNVRISAKYVSSRNTYLSDALSRRQMTKFWDKAPTSMNKQATAISPEIWPIQNIWSK